MLIMRKVAVNAKASARIKLEPVAHFSFVKNVNEELFFNNNAKTAIAVAQARGVLVAEVAARGIPIYEYTPLQIKQAITGYGRADKSQIQQMVKMLLNLNAIPKPDDAADALAVAICHANSSRINDELGTNRL